MGVGHIQMLKFVRQSAFKLSTQSSVPVRGVQDFYRHGFIDPTATADEKEANARTGDAWPTALLRRKSFDDLRKLYYVLLKEKHHVMTERNAFYQYSASMPGQGRFKKVRLSIKRLLTVVTQREIHEQGLRAKEISQKQKIREDLETKRFHLEESIQKLRHQLRRLETKDSLMRGSWRQMLQQQEADLTQLMITLRPLRKETMQILTPDWRYHGKYSDLPGRIKWRPIYARGLREIHKKPVRYY
eukprot:GDKJ01037395.1.p1 GENE.GDKJ01037395.1~~GDKJ01037395.1.p1  ORF type:complete len:244 (+),score=32.65 GDKJ01037395.1:1-732(+)